MKSTPGRPRGLRRAQRLAPLPCRMWTTGSDAAEVAHGRLDATHEAAAALLADASPAAALTCSRSAIAKQATLASTLTITSQMTLL